MTGTGPIETKRHYPFVSRMVATLFNSGMLPNVLSVEIEKEYGYVVRLVYVNGAVRMTRGNDVGLNPGAATEIAKDKAYTKFFLRRSGISVPDGESFLLDWWASSLHAATATRGGPKARTRDQVLPFIVQQLDWPVFIKPVDGSKGVDVWCCRNPVDVKRALDIFETNRVKLAVVERDVAMPDYRLVILNDELISAYQRKPLSIVGDGLSDVRELLAAQQEEFLANGRETRLSMDDLRLNLRMEHLDIKWTTKLPRGTRVQLHDISNLSAGGTALECTAVTAHRWKKLAIDASRMLGLRFCGVDLACHDIASPDGDYAILELNATPGLDHYVSVGADQAETVKSLYSRVLNVPPIKGAAF